MSDYIKKVYYFLKPVVNHKPKNIFNFLIQDNYLLCATIVATTSFTFLTCKAVVWWIKKRRRIATEARRLKKVKASHDLKLESLTPKPQEVEPCTLLRKKQNNKFSSEYEMLMAFLNAKRHAIFEKYPFMKYTHIRSSITELVIKLMKDETEDNRMPYYYGVTKIKQELGEFGKVPSDMSINSVSTYYSESDLREEEKRQEERFEEFAVLFHESQRNYKLDVLYQKVESLEDDNSETAYDTDDSEESRRLWNEESQAESFQEEFVSMDKQDSEAVQEHEHVEDPKSSQTEIEQPDLVRQKTFPKSRSQEAPSQSKIPLLGGRKSEIDIRKSQHAEIIRKYVIKKQSMMSIHESTPKEVKETAVVKEEVKDVKKPKHTEIYREYLHKKQCYTSIPDKVIRDAKISPHAIEVTESVYKTLVTDKAQKGSRETSPVKPGVKSAHTVIVREYLNKTQSKSSISEKVIRDATISPHAMVVTESVYNMLVPEERQKGSRETNVRDYSQNQSNTPKGDGIEESSQKTEDESCTESVREHLKNQPIEDNNESAQEISLKSLDRTPQPYFRAHVNDMKPLSDISEESVVTEETAKDVRYAMPGEIIRRKW